jgi:hypothetical protein
MYAFEEFPKIPRLKREVVITEKVDGTNAQVALVELNDLAALGNAQLDPFCLRIYPGVENGANAFALYAGSRTRWLDTSSKGDNFGFAKWALDHSDELYALGPGRHYGEWYGLGIQRDYGLKEKRFALFNVGRWTAETKPACCDVVPIILRGEDASPVAALSILKSNGSFIAPGFANPEGIIVYHSASRQMYKMTIKEDGGKWREPKNYGTAEHPCSVPPPSSPDYSPSPLTHSDSGTPL